MKNFLLLFILLYSFNLYSQNYWSPTDEGSILLNRDTDRGIVPVKYSTNHLNINEFTKYLKSAPKQFNKHDETIPVYIPMPNGKVMLFDVVKSPVMMPELAKKYPSIKSYKGISHENSEINIRFNIGPNGFYASIYWKNNNIYIDPYAKGVTDYYISYFTKDYKVDISDYILSCGLDTEYDPDFDELDFPNLHDEKLVLRDESNCDSVQQYNYRLALSCTGEWGKRHGGTKERALADMVTSVNRVNQIYENEFAIHLNLIGKNDELIWLDPDTDPFDNPTIGSALLLENFDAINNTIKMNSYDIGHVFTNSCQDVGGIARLESVCADFKAMGVTCHYSNNLDYIVTNVTAHEMGHQFGANHTFNNCGGNESSFGYEPGGGTTIMAYCGLCGSNNVDYPCLETFHAFSIDQIKSYSREFGGSTCAEKISTSNTAPELSLEYEDGFYIPISTPFVLRGSAFDCEGDDLLYSWEQMDTGPITPYGIPIEDSPLFTAKEPVSSPERYFPKLRDILYNLSSTSEILPTYERNMNFRLIVRDNHQGAGATTWKDVSFKVDGSAGPFAVTFPNSTASFHAGEALEVKWNVSNTDNEKVNCQQVNILLSTDIGYTYPYTLKYQTENDGSEIIYLPDTITNKARIKVEAANNIFFDVANHNIKIEEPKDTTFVMDVGQVSGRICLPTSVETSIQTRGTHDFSDSIRFEIVGLPENTEYIITPTEIIAGESVNVEFNFDNVDNNGYYEPIILGISNNGDTVSRTIDWDLFTNRFDRLEILNPLPGSTGNPQNPTFLWQKPNNAEFVNIYLSKNPSFPENETITKSFIRDTFFNSEDILDYSSLYYWKLEFGNECGIVSADTIYTFSTFATNCSDYVAEDVPVGIKSNKTVSSIIDIEDDIFITDINVTMKGFHQYFKEISASLVAPDSTKVLLFNHKNFNYQGNFNLSFNDEALYNIKSPPSGTFKPDKPLNSLIGKNGKGSWALEVTDNKTQQSGKIEYFALNICANVVLSNPVLVNNSLFKLPINAAWPVKTENLKTIDENNTDDELLYTIVKEPELCHVFNGDLLLTVGGTFTQSDINNGNVKIKYNGDDEIKDKFYFTVFDGVGGWINITPFHFETDLDINAVDELFEEYVNIYPNPSQSSINIDIEKSGKYNLEMYTLEGRKVLSKTVFGNGISNINISRLNTGIYIIKINNEKYNFVGKIVKQN